MNQKQSVYIKYAFSFIRNKLFCKTKIVQIKDIFTLEYFKKGISNQYHTTFLIRIIDECFKDFFFHY